MTGPIWPISFWPACIAVALATTASSSACCSPTMSRTDAAMHRWPALPAKEAQMSEAAMSTAQSSSATRWFFAPPRQIARLPACVARRCRAFATAVEPTKVKAVMPGWSASASATSRSPRTTLKTPLGQPASWRSSAMRMTVSGTFSLGLKTMVFPHPMAIGIVQSGTMAGKLNGTTDATTPMGSRYSLHSTPTDTSSSFPGSSCGSEQAYSTVSMPFAREARASGLHLPCSLTMMSESSSACASRRCLNLKSTWARCLTVVALHSGKAAAAALTALSTSDLLESGHCAMVEPSAGSMTAKERVALGASGAPLIQFCSAVPPAVGEACRDRCSRIRPSCPACRWPRTFLRRALATPAIAQGGSDPPFSGEVGGRPGLETFYYYS
mmetsp:Transcript_29136/g.64111  ORF Transcript_29136/g.64111 Transcript_29136/m.64111 type:complete len:384 (+) Transcript_29136:683-1834(+)